MTGLELDTQQKFTQPGSKVFGSYDWGSASVAAPFLGQKDSVKTKEAVGKHYEEVVGYAQLLYR